MTKLADMVRVLHPSWIADNDERRPCACAGEGYWDTSEYETIRGCLEVSSRIKNESRGKVSIVVKY